MTVQKSRGRRAHLDPMERARRLNDHIHLLAFAVAGMMIVAGIGLRLYPSQYLLLVAGLLAYPLTMRAVRLLAERRDWRLQRLAPLLMQLDAAIIGVACAGVHFAVMPTLVLLIIVHASAMSRGGLGLWLSNLLMTTLGAAAGALALGVPAQPGPASLSLAVLSLLGLGLYVGAAAFYARQQAQFLQLAQSRVREQQQQAVELSRKLAKYLPPQIWGSLFSGKRDAKLETRRKRLTVFFSDIKGFSNISEQLPLDTLTRLLNRYLSDMTRIALRHGGTIDKFIGDAVMVFFGDPKSAGAQEDAYRCTAMAIEMQQHMGLLRQRWKREGIDAELAIRIGINTGYATVGNFGTDSRMDYTILGTDVNLASRLESACVPGKVLVSEATHELIKNRIRCRSVGEIQVKGFNRPIAVFEALEVKRNAGDKRRFVTVEADGFGLHMDLERIHNFDQKRILKTLARAATDLKRANPVTLDFEAEGFVLHVDSEGLRQRERERMVDLMGRAARKIQEQVRM